LPISEINDSVAVSGKNPQADDLDAGGRLAGGRPVPARFP
jgi:hypothetical protein